MGIEPRVVFRARGALFRLTIDRRVTNTYKPLNASVLRQLSQQALAQPQKDAAR